MKIFPRFLLFCVVFLAALGAFFAVKNRDSLPKIEMPEIEITQKKDISENNFSDIEGAAITEFSMVSISQSDDFHNISAEFPQIAGADKQFNQKIASLVENKIEEFKIEAKANWEARRATTPEGEPIPETPEQPFDFIADWTPARLGPKYASFMMGIYYFSGGAHGISEIYAFNYDLKEKKEITIADFLGSGDELQKLAQMAANRVEAQLEGAGFEANEILRQMIASGTAPDDKNYLNFTFNGNLLKIYFEKYQAAPGSAGTITVEFYKNELEQNEIFSDYLG